jgi:hypothetical protein
VLSERSGDHLDDYQTETLGHPECLLVHDNGMRPQSSLTAPMAVMGRIVGTIEVQLMKRTLMALSTRPAMRMAANLTAVRH